MVRNITDGRAPPQKVRRRRDSKVAFYNNSSKQHHRNGTTNATTAVSPLGRPSWRPDVQIHQQLSSGQTGDVDFMDMFDFQSSGRGGLSIVPSSPRQNQNETSWPSSSVGSYTLPARPPNSPQSHGGVPVTPSNDPLAEMYSDDLQASWLTMVPLIENFHTDPDVMSNSFDSHESFNSLALTINTDASSVSEGFPCPESTTSSASPELANLQDLYLPGS